MTQFDPRFSSLIYHQTPPQEVARFFQSVITVVDCLFPLFLFLFPFYLSLNFGLFAFHSCCFDLSLLMLPPIPSLSDYGISPEYGFLPPEAPLEVLPHPYYAKWEAAIANLHALLLSRRLRRTIAALPVLSTRYLKSEAEWRRAYVILSMLLHSYIWGGDQAAEVSLSLQPSTCLFLMLTAWHSAGTTHSHNSPLQSM